MIGLTILAVLALATATFVLGIALARRNVLGAISGSDSSVTIEKGTRGELRCEVKVYDVCPEIAQAIAQVEFMKCAVFFEEHQKALQAEGEKEGQRLVELLHASIRRLNEVKPPAA